MTTWKGYTQHPEALEDRPWWRLMMRIESDPEDILKHERVDGTILSALVSRAHDGLADYDREHPLPAPEPKCGQVLLVPTGGTTTIQSVSPCGLWVALPVWSTHATGMVVRLADAPPRKAQFELATVHVSVIEKWPRVSGEGSPWMDTGGEE